MTNLYPESPGNYPVLLQPTLLFKQQIVKVISYIVLFFLLYVALLLTAVTLAIACLAGGITLIRVRPGILTVILGVSLMVLGGMVLFFLIKFLFNKRAPVNPYRTQINADNHPRLFHFISQLVKDTRISFPKKIFVVPEVNAAVFYNSSLLSLFWPAHKNLEIGLGLVNSVNISEFKMVLAREFAHFSQRRMKLGSYIYVWNKLLYNMLYENDSWNEAIIRLSSGGSLLGFFAQVTTWIVNGIQYLLRKLYPLVNREYMELSREMEFHADAVAVALAGTKTAISSIRRVEMGSYCLDYCLHKLPELDEQSQRFRNIFTVQRELIRYFAGQQHMSLDEQQLPVITDAYFHSFVKTRVQLRDQWTSHPTREDREARYLQANISCREITESAWLLFNEPEHLQEHITNQVYRITASHGHTHNLLEPSVFISDLEKRHRLYEYPRVFNDYYDNRVFPEITDDFTIPLSAEEACTHTLQTIYHPGVIWRMRGFYRDRQDLETLQAIAIGQIQTRFFEFDGQKHTTEDAGALFRQLSDQVSKDRQWLAAQDTLAFRYHYNNASCKNPETAAALVARYQQVLIYQDYASRLNDQVIMIIHGISQLFSMDSQSMEQMEPHFEELSAECWKFRKLLHEITSSREFFLTFSPGMIEHIQRFRQQECIFLRDHVPDYVAIQELHEITSSVMEEYNNSIILRKKEFLEFVLTLEPAV